MPRDDLVVKGSPVADHRSWNLLILTGCVGRGGLWGVCGQRGRESEGEGEGERGGEEKVEGERGGEGKAEGERGGEGERGRRGKERGRRRRRGGRGLWALGGNLCLAFEGWGSYNLPFVTSRKR